MLGEVARLVTLGRASERAGAGVVLLGSCRASGCAGVDTVAGRSGPLVDAAGVRVAGRGSTGLRSDRESARTVVLAANKQTRTVAAALRRDRKCWDLPGARTAEPFLVNLAVD